MIRPIKTQPLIPKTPPAYKPNTNRDFWNLIKRSVNYAIQNNRKR